MFTLIAALISLFANGNEINGVMNGGGGKGVTCSQGAGLEVLEIYEARAVHGLIVESSKGDLADNMAFAFRRLNEVWSSSGGPVSRGFALSWLAEFFQKVDFVDTQLPNTEDATLPYLAEGCSFQQVAIFDDETKRLKIDRAMWNLLDSQNKAALILHEELYYFRRLNGSTTSDETRYFVARLLSSTPLTPRFGDKPESDFFTCYAGIDGETPHYDSYVYPAGQSGFVFSFQLLNSSTLLSRTTAYTADRGFFEQLVNPTGFFKVAMPLNSQTLKNEDRVLVIEKKRGEKHMWIWVERGGVRLGEKSELYCH